jgi:hypothetical protein
VKKKIFFFLFIFVWEGFSCILGFCRNYHVSRNEKNLFSSSNRCSKKKSVVVNQKSVIDGKIAEGFGPAIDAAMQLCALTDTYMEKAKLVIGQTMATASQQCPAIKFEMDWGFVEHANYVKLAEDARAAAVNNCATLLKAGMLEKKDGLASHLQRSQRAVNTFREHVETVMLTVDADNRCKAPFELSEAGAGVLRVSFRLNLLDKGTTGWGPAVDDRFSLRVVDEEGMRQVQMICEQLVQQLPQSTRLEVDWNFTLNDKWRKMKPEERAAVFASICKKTLPSGVNDKRDGLAGLFSRSNRAREQFCQKVGVVLLRLEMGGAVKPILMEGGVLSLPCLLASVDEAQPWGSLVDTALGLRVQDEAEIRKMEAAIEKTGCAGLPVQVDWSFLDEPNLPKSAWALLRACSASCRVAWAVAPDWGRMARPSHRTWIACSCGQCRQ